MASNAKADTAFANLTVGDVIHTGDAYCKLRLHDALGDLASALAASSSTAAAVVDMNGELLGLLTENDVMHFYWEGASATEHLADWWNEHQDEARAPRSKLDRLTVPPSTQLSEVAEIMVDNALSGDCACHHVVVQEEESKDFAVLSSLDLVQALCRLASPEDWHPPTKKQRLATGESKHTRAAKDVMKSLESVLTCPPSSTMKDVLKVLLLTQQNSALVVDGRGIYGIVTPRDAIRAFSDGVSNSVVISDWLESTHGDPQKRMMAGDTPLMEAEALMSFRGLNHFVVVKPGTSEAIGTLSASDIALSSLGPSPATCFRGPRSAGPAVGEIVCQAWHRRTSCNEGATLAEVAEQMAHHGHATTSAMLSLGGADDRQVLVTETDIMKAFTQGFPRTQALADYLSAAEKEKRSFPQHLLVPASMSLSEGASVMLRSAAQQGRSCHHLAVSSDNYQDWLGVLSALDLVRGLTTMCSQLEIAKMGADDTTIASVMKPMSSVPTCHTNHTVHNALVLLLRASQTAALVLDDTGAPLLDGVITPRCAMQALADGVLVDTSVGAWLQNRRAGEGPREVPPTIKLFDAALLMSRHQLHHLVVAERPYCTQPIGVLSSLDVVRGISSIHAPMPFTSLEWLKSCRGSTACVVRGL
eukprot:TRINITY_DN121364_c0_g1_i1.p1 TRINITY_DN121364_c0_g1~~TRINITY_DN121364_c0_g1_i1.p1  ORF type:complete len:668 (-),score=91.52 TRINITY_DN121364_c0_g1_i1:497-2431(-)